MSYPLSSPTSQADTVRRGETDILLYMRLGKDLAIKTLHFSCSSIQTFLKAFAQNICKKNTKKLVTFYIPYLGSAHL